MGEQIILNNKIINVNSDEGKLLLGHIAMQSPELYKFFVSATDLAQQAEMKKLIDKVFATKTDSNP